MYDDPCYRTEPSASERLDAMMAGAAEDLQPQILGLSEGERELLLALLDCLRAIMTEGAAKALHSQIESLPDNLQQLLLAILNRVREEVAINCQKRADEIDRHFSEKRPWPGRRIARERLEFHPLRLSTE